MKKQVMFFLALVVLFTILVSAGFDIGDKSHSIAKSYAPGSLITGWINMSFENEDVNSLFETSEGDSITFKSLLELNDLLDNVDCLPLDCEIDYGLIPGSGAQQKTFSLEKDAHITIGFKIAGGVVSDISDFSINITSDAPAHPSPQLLIDFFDDETIEWQPSIPSGAFRAEKYGCYNESVEGQAKIFDQEYCEQINIPQAPNVLLGAVVIESEEGGEEVNFELSIYKKDYSDYSSCTATAAGTEKINCTPQNFHIKEQDDFYVCIKTKNSVDNDKYLINYERQNVCGFTEYSPDFHTDFEIFARAGAYAALGNIILNNTELAEAGYSYGIENEIWNYIDQKYNNDCSDECVVPIKFISGVDGQEITISGFSISYLTDIREGTNILYETTETPAKINSDFLRIYLNDANFSVPSSYGNHTFLLEFDGSDVFEEEISVEKIPVITYILPTQTAAAVPTIFKTVVDISDSEANITKYEWNFGDNNTLTTQKNKITHTYSYTGTYKLTVTITDSNGRSSSKSILVNVKTPKESIKKSLEQKTENLEYIKNQMDVFPVFHRNSVYSLLNLTESKTKLDEISEDYNATNNQTPVTEYISMMQELLEIEVPKSIDITASADSILFYPQEENIDLDILLLIAGGTYEPSETQDYINTLLFWNQENLETEVSYEEITVTYPTYKKVLLKVFELETKKIDSPEEIPYIIIKELDCINFKEDYDEKMESGYYYVELEDSEKTIEFSTTQDVSFVDLPAFISPSLITLELIKSDISGTVREGRTISWKETLLVLLIVLLILIGITVYIILQKWYKKKYEGHLFKSKNELYNLMSYITRMKHKGAKKKEISHNLKGAKWSSEQVKYAMRKHSKKRTGMLELPVDKLIENLKKKKQEKGTDRY